MALRLFGTIVGRYWPPRSVFGFIGIAEARSNFRSRRVSWRFSFSSRCAGKPSPSVCALTDLPFQIGGPVAHLDRIDFDTLAVAPLIPRRMALDLPLFAGEQFQFPVAQSSLARSSQ